METFGFFSNRVDLSRKFYVYHIAISKPLKKKPFDTGPPLWLTFLLSPQKEHLRDLHPFSPSSNKTGGDLRIGKVAFGGNADISLKTKLKSVNISLDEKHVKAPKSLLGSNHSVLEIISFEGYSDCVSNTFARSHTFTLSLSYSDTLKSNHIRISSCPCFSEKMTTAVLDGIRKHLASAD
ncbi:hypothetical protein CDAR_376021 [Caerostris darwini]|uniref:Uncharacterized protein n=1 Tax=Caerostris darwini TaxID=1538125 RepID=A0AAV4UI78_9ARAC|nr:hypothetical protein CDAR_376021 [Caerostris darwini]